MQNMTTPPHLKKFVDELFVGIIGQPKAKKALAFYLETYRDTRYLPHLLVKAARGMGKTTIVKAIAKNLWEFDDDGQVVMIPSKKNANKMVPKKKDFVEIDCTTIKNLRQFFDKVLIPYVIDKNVTIFFDEASELPRQVIMAMLVMLNPNNDYRTTYLYEEYVADFDFRKQTFIFATNEVQKLRIVSEAFVDRLEPIALEDYSMNDLSEIVRLGVPNVEFEDNVLEDVATVLRGNARAAQKMAMKINTYCKNRPKFTLKDWDVMKDNLSIAPLGLDIQDIAILRLLQGNANGTSLTGLSAKTGLSRECLRRDGEMYLQKHGLMEITTGGRQITQKGREYLRDLPKTFAQCS